jgi:hypothetical protein
VPYNFALINPPTGFSITSTGEIQVLANAPAFSGILRVSCTNGINATTAAIQFSWVNPTKTAMFSENGELQTLETGCAAIEQTTEMSYGLLQTIGASIAELEEIEILTMNAISGSATTIELAPNALQITAGGLTWGASFWDASFSGYVESFTIAAYTEVYHALGPVGSATGPATLVCNATLRAELLNSARIYFNSPTLTYYDCLSGLNQSGTESALYYFIKP